MKLDGAADYCYITTTGRVTGRPHEIEIWFALNGPTLYVLAGSRHNADFVRNAVKQPRVTVQLGTRESAEMQAMARMVQGGDEDALGRKLLLAKYAPGNEGSLEDWGRTALVVAFDLDLDEA